jgi:hypothetical protein
MGRGPVVHALGKHSRMLSNADSWRPKPATSWVRSLRSPSLIFGLASSFPSLRVGSPNTFPNSLRHVLQYDNVRVADEGSGRNTGLSRLVGLLADRRPAARDGSARSARRDAGVVSGARVRKPHRGAPCFHDRQHTIEPSWPASLRVQSVATSQRPIHSNKRTRCRGRDQLLAACARLAFSMDSRVV